MPQLLRPDDDEIERLLGLQSTETQIKVSKSTAAKSGKSSRQDSETSSSSRGFYLLPISEPSSESKHMRGEMLRANELLRKYEKEQQECEASNRVNDGGSGSGFAEEEYEVDQEKDFRRFIDRLERMPDQCIRYELNGSPIGADARRLSLDSANSKCSKCGTNRYDAMFNNN